MKPVKSTPPPGSSQGAALGWAFDQFGTHLRKVADRGLGADLAAKVGASDVVQDTFVAASRDLGDFRGQTPRELRAWLEAILRHRLAFLRRHFRGSARRRVDREVPISYLESPTSGRPRADLPATTTGSPLSQIVRAERVEALRAAIGLLSDQDQQVIHWRHQDRLAFEVIGTRLGIPADTARKRWARAMLRLRKVMEDNDDPRS